MQRGFFRQQGLTITTTTVPTSTLAIPALLKGQVDVIASANYVSFFAGAARGALSIKVIAPAASCRDKNFAVVTPEGSPITRISDLAGKTIGVPALGSVATLTIDFQLRDAGVNPAQVHYVVVPFVHALAALEEHEVDAVSFTEPFLTGAEVSGGVQTVLAQCTGPTASFPLTGDVTTATEAARDPRTMAAFARAEAEGAQVAATDHPAEEKAMAALVKLTPTSSYALVNYSQYPTSLNPVAIQQVATLMREDGLLSKPLNVTPLLFRPQAGGAG